MRNIRNFILITSLLLGLGMFPLTVLANVTAQLERDTIHADQTVRLIIESDDTNSDGQPDLTVLDKNFKVIGTSISQNVSIVNGKQTSQKRWITELEPKAEGSFTIPAISVAGKITKPQRLTVLPRKPLRTGQVGDVFVEMEADPLESYVQQQVNLVVRLYLGVRILDGTLSDPEPKNTDVRRLGNDIQYEAVIGGRDYRVIERKYALFPGESGQLLVPAIRFNGLAEDQSSAGNQVFGGLFNQGTRVKALSEHLTLEVAPPNPAFTGHTWLPAKNLQVREESSEFKEVPVGQPITRQILISAVGLTGEQLPDIDFQDSPDFKQYPDKTIRESQHDGTDIVGLVKRSIAVISSKEGRITLPSIRLNWWSTVSGEMETAVLPEKTIIFVADPSATQTTVTDQSDASISIKNSAPESQSTVTDDSHDNNSWRLVSIILLAGWMLTLAFYWKKIKIKPNENNLTSSKPIPDQSSSELLAKIKRACKANDSRQTRILLHTWAKSRWPDSPFQTLEDISKRLGSAELANELLLLDKYLYANSDHRRRATDSTPIPGTSSAAWSGSTLYRLLATLPVLKSGKPNISKKSLPQLYPQWQ